MRAEIGIIGGTGVYEFEGIANPKWRVVKTPYGKVEILLGSVGSRSVGFLSRHGRTHKLPPHKVNYRANLWALWSIGVQRILGITACGSLNPVLKPGELVLPDQFIDFTKGRIPSFYEGGRKGVVHVDVTNPYCPELRTLVAGVARRMGFRVHRKATYVCTEGPRFETAAEIRMFRRLGGDLVGMTNVPECVLARELEMCYAVIGVVTNFAAGISKTKLTHTEVVERMGAGIKKIKGIVSSVIPEVPRERSCPCRRALEGAVVRP